MIVALSSKIGYVETKTIDKPGEWSLLNELQFQRSK